MSDSKNITSGSIGFTGMLTILFIGLKLCNVIEWSWWWVLSPTLIPVGIIIAIFSMVLMVQIVCD